MNAIRCIVAAVCVILLYGCGSGNQSRPSNQTRSFHSRTYDTTKVGLLRSATPSSKIAVSLRLPQRSLIILTIRDAPEGMVF
jgi:hypothetical protein